MSSYKPVILVLGAGKNIGSSVARLFHQKGYNVALAARRLQDTTTEEGYMHIQTDLSDANSIQSTFDKVEAGFGPANVVVYNAAAVKVVPANDPLALTLADFNNDITLNTASVLVAGRRATQGFQKLPSDVLKTFIYTGNFLNTEVVTPLVSLGIGKSATAHLIAAAALGYRKEGYRFYYADERKEDGKSAGQAVNGDAHAQLFHDLAQSSSQKPWLQTFVNGQGYKEFPGTGYVADAAAA